MDKKDHGRPPFKALSIAMVERDTGLSKDTLRMWERRYGFPRPARDGNGARTYTPDQLDRLRLIRRCMDLGLRPGKIVAASMHELIAHTGNAVDVRNKTKAPTGPLPGVLQLLKAQRVAEMRDFLVQAVMRLGVLRFILDVIVPINAEVGHAWMRGEIAIHEEHLYSEQVQHLLRQAIGSAMHRGLAPRVMLTTLPGEEHQLGVLMAQTFLSVEGAQCISLGVQTPASDIVSAARAHGVDIVGLSFSQAMQPRNACTGLADLRQRLDSRIELWAGGALWSRVRKSVPGVRFLSSLTDIPPALADWRARRSGRAA